VSVPALNESVTPAGRPDTVAPVAFEIVYVIVVIGLFRQAFWLAVTGADDKLMLGGGVITTFMLVAGLQQPVAKLNVRM
jgi:hypothetical protein